MCSCPPRDRHLNSCNNNLSGNPALRLPERVCSLPTNLSQKWSVSCRCFGMASRPWRTSASTQLMKPSAQFWGTDEINWSASRSRRSRTLTTSAVDRLTLKNRLADPSSRNLPLPAVVGVNSDEDEENDQGQGGSPLMLKPPGGDSEKDRRKKVRTAATAADVSSPKRILEEGQEGQSGGEHV